MPVPVVGVAGGNGTTRSFLSVPVVGVAGENGTTCSFYPACVAAGITEGDCCPNAEQAVEEASCASQ
eukprot:Skav205024  [mRNA]  locus=scaffold1026:356509:357116:- [translate_table: standard]